MMSQFLHNALILFIKLAHDKTQKKWLMLGLEHALSDLHPISLTFITVVHSVKFRA